MTIERAEPIDRAYGLRYATTCFWWALRDAVSTPEPKQRDAATAGHETRGDQVEWKR